jgi:membrane dipeptidase
MKHILTVLIFLFLTCYFNFTVSGNEPDKDLRERAVKLHEEAIVIDAHAHPFIFKSKPGELDLGIDSQTSQVDFVKMKKGGMDAVFYSLLLPVKYDSENLEEIVSESVVTLKTLLKKYPEKAVLAFTPGDLDKALDSGKRAVFLSTEYQNILKGDPAKMVKYYGMGYRSMVVAHSRAAPIADSQQEDPGDKGLSDFGRKLIKSMNDVGMMVDITHSTDQLQLDIIQLSRAPVIASHSCTRAVNNRPRNIPDRIIKALAKKGGVIAVTLGSTHVSAQYRKELKQATEKFKPIEAELKKKFKDNPEKQEEAIEKAWAKYRPPAANIEKLIDHIDHIVKLVGPDYIGIGSDYGGPRSFYTKGLEDASGWPLITYHLLKRGYNEEDIKKILGGNLLRVFKVVQKTAVK